MTTSIKRTKINEDAGEYIATATNSYGSTSEIGFLNVERKFFCIFAATERLMRRSVLPSIHWSVSNAFLCNLYVELFRGTYWPL